MRSLAITPFTVMMAVQMCSSFTLKLPQLRRKHRFFERSETTLLSTLDSTEEQSTSKNYLADGDELARRKRLLLNLLGSSSVAIDQQQPQSSQFLAEQTTFDPIFACPITKGPLEVQLNKSPIIGGSSSGVGVLFTSLSSNDAQGNEVVYQYEGRTDTYYNLLTPVNKTESNNSTVAELFIKSLETALPLVTNALLFLPPPIRTVLQQQNKDFILKRDLFTSPTVSFAYERGWRQGFAAAGFPGPDKELEMANELFSSSVLSSPGRRTTIVDMSCATGIFTRRFALSGLYSRVIGCDYSDSMLQEARRRIQSDRFLQSKLRNGDTTLELVRCDVAAIPMQSNSVDFVNAGAAMHCWPDVPTGLLEIHRILRPGGKYFASTFLSKYFKAISSEGAYNDFESKEMMESLLRNAGFSTVFVEILGAGCVIIRCEK